MKVKFFLAALIAIALIASHAFSEENESITFALPQAVIVNPELLCQYPEFDLAKEAVYNFDYLFAEDARKWIVTRIGSLGFMTSSTDKESKTIGISYLSLPRREPECEILIPHNIAGISADDCALQMVIIPSRRGPNSLTIALGLKNGSYSKSIEVKLKSATLVLVPFQLFDAATVPCNVKRIKIIVPGHGDRDGIGSYSIAELAIVKR
ncbi:MAG: hypothetical protein PHQ54_00725 [Candidatus Omnitrophica bacterium]|nr:hypothetical protein [Candidatus Omnitrophota bacterium]